MAGHRGAEAGPIRFAVITVSDRCARGEQRDESGELIADRCAALPADQAARVTVPDEVVEIRDAVRSAAAIADLVVLTGGTGLGHRDVTPQALDGLLDYEVPGMAEVMRSRGMTSTPHAMLSRQLAGVRDRCLVLALPGSRGAVSDCLDAVWPALPHALALLGDPGVEHSAAHR
ncbi:MAG: molybdenum cofactor biosynthesis protein B [Candidatus Dormibacteria bacterium]